MRHRDQGCCDGNSISTPFHGNFPAYCHATSKLERNFPVVIDFRKPSNLLCYVESVRFIHRMICWRINGLLTTSRVQLSIDSKLHWKSLRFKPLLNTFTRSLARIGRKDKPMKIDNWTPKKKKCVNCLLTFWRQRMRTSRAEKPSEITRYRRSKKKNVEKCATKSLNIDQPSSMLLLAAAAAAAIANLVDC